MKIEINKKSATPLYLQIANILKEKIQINELFDGYKLPTERHLAEELEVHRNTVIKAYSKLIEDELIVASRTSPKGYFVSTEKKSPLPKNIFSSLESEIRYELDVKVNLFGDIYEDSDNVDKISFGGMQISEEAYPAEAITKILMNIGKENGKKHYGYSPSKSRYDLREKLISTLKKRNIEVTSKNIQVISETLQGLEYITRMYLKPGDIVISEEPIVPETIAMFLNYGVRVITIPMQADGINLTLLEEEIKKHRPRFIYVQPNFHIPTGIQMSYEKRKKLLECIYKYNIPLVEEDSQRELYYEEPLLPTLYAMDQRKQIVYIDSFAFTSVPATIFGYILAPSEVAAYMGKIIRMEQILVSGLSQGIISEFLGPDYESHVAFLRNHYKKKRDLACAELNKLKTKIDGLEFEKPKGGLIIWVKLPQEVNERALFKKATENGLLYMPGYLFFPNGNVGEAYLRLCFSKVDDMALISGIKLLGELIKEEQSS